MVLPSKSDSLDSEQLLVLDSVGDQDLAELEKSALSDNRERREHALQLIVRTANRGALGILKKQADRFPGDLEAILRAIGQLGFGKGLDIAFEALKRKQVEVQRAALETIETLTKARHADNVRRELLGSFPYLTDEMREFAKMLIAQLTQDFYLPDIRIGLDAPSAANVDAGALAGEIARYRTQPSKVSLDSFGPGQLWLDRYHIEEEIGRGAMGRVMLARDAVLEESIVLKFLLPDLTIDRESITRFRREVKYARRVTHRNVIRVHDILLKDGVCAISMEYFRSRGLESVMREIGCFGSLEGLRIFYQIAKGLAEAHAEGVIHRDLKPSNILINDRRQVKIVDFGLAFACTVSDATLTQTGTILGSPAYLSPERADGIRADERSDIYSLGIIAYLMFSGRIPYVGKPMEVLSMHRRGNAPPIVEVRDGVSPEVSVLIEQMIAVDPQARPQTMAEVRDRIRKLISGYSRPDVIV